MATDLTRYQPNRGFTRLPDLMNQLLQESFVLPSAFERGLAPRLIHRVLETDDSYIVQVALPGVEANTVDIQVAGQEMTLKGSYQIPTPEGAQVLWGGLSGGDFTETLSLPGEIDPGRAEAQYDAGILAITIPKSEHAKPRSIKVRTDR